MLGRGSPGDLGGGFCCGCPIPAIPIPTVSSSSSHFAKKKKKKTLHLGVAFLRALELQGSSAGAVSWPSLSLSVSSPCHVPSVFSPALRFLCLMSHLYILQVVCLAFISPISAFLEGWKGRGVGGCVSVLPAACSSPAADTEPPGQIPLGVRGVPLTHPLQEASLEHHCSSIPSSPCPAAAFAAEPGHPSSRLLPQRGKSIWDRVGPHSLGHRFA